MEPRGLFAVMLVIMTFAWAGKSLADERLVWLAVPPEIVDSGLPKFMLPRFTLKTQVREELVAPGQPAEAAIGDEGQAVFSGLGRNWYLQVLAGDHSGTLRLADWITSEVGQRAITGYRADGAQLFDLPQEKAPEVVEVTFDGDAALGRELSRAMCARCHVVIAEERMNAIGSTPSFFVLRSRPDWADRFETFYVLNPHPAFTQLEGVTPPFPADRPSPIVPLEMQLEHLEAILAYVSGLPPADLGAPLQHQ